MTKTTKTKTNYLSNPAPNAVAVRHSSVEAIAARLLASADDPEVVDAYGQQVRLALVREAATFMVEQFAEQITNQLSQRTLEHYDAFLQGRLALLDQPRDDRAQADLEDFDQDLKLGQRTSLMALRNTGVNHIEVIVSEPLHQPVKKLKKTTITEEPPFLAKLVGARTKTTVIEE
jgi:hypothetical protein